MKRHWFFTKRGLTKAVGVRFGLIVFLFQALSIVGVGVYAGQTMWEKFERHELVPVRRFRDSVLANYHAAGINGLTSYVKTRVSTDYTPDIVLMLTAPDGRILAGNLTQWPSHLFGDSNWSTGTLRVIGAKRDQHMGVLLTQLDGGYRLLVGTAINSRDGIVESYFYAIMLSLVVATFTSFLIAGTASYMTARQLSGIVGIATQLSEGEFSGRLKINGSGDRFDDLMHWINRMLARLDSLVSELREVSSGLAHDLRSPIGRLRVILERGLKESNDPVALAAMQKMMIETDALLAMLAMTLQISSVQAGASRNRFKMTDVGELLQDIAEIYGPLAEEGGFSITVSAAEGMSKMVHRELLGQALSNLIENALKYADGGSKIVLSASRHENMLTISVADDGLGIPAHRRADAKRRYGRLDSARQLPGAGLGLSLVQAVARLHGGDMSLAENAPGLIVAMTFPAKTI